jgi:hypothetical protein
VESALIIVPEASLLTNRRISWHAGNYCSRCVITSGTDGPESICIRSSIDPNGGSRNSTSRSEGCALSSTRTRLRQDSWHRSFGPIQEIMGKYVSSLFAWPRRSSPGQLLKSCSCRSELPKRMKVRDHEPADKKLIYIFIFFFSSFFSYDNIRIKIKQIKIGPALCGRFVAIRGTIQVAPI